MSKSSFAVLLVSDQAHSELPVCHIFVLWHMLLQDSSVKHTASVLEVADIPWPRNMELLYLQKQCRD